MKNYKIYLLCFFWTVLYVNNINGQTKITGTATNPEGHPSSVLDISSTEKGLLLPRLTHAQMKAIASPAEGLAIYNTTEKCVFTWTGTIWKSMCRQLELLMNFNTIAASNVAHTGTIDKTLATISIPVNMNADRDIIIMGTIPWNYTDNTAYISTESRDYVEIEILDANNADASLERGRIFNGRTGFVKGTGWNQTATTQSYWQKFFIPAGANYKFRIAKVFGVSPGTSGAFAIQASTGTYYTIKNY